MPLHARRGRATAAALLLAAALAGCTPSVDNHGHRLDDAAIAQLRPGATSREQVLRLLGSPSALASFEDSSWYYISQRTEQMSFYQTAVVDQQVLAVHFDERGVVTAIERHDLADARDITPVAETTPTFGNEVTVMQQLLGNIGRFNPAPGALNPAGSASTGRDW